MDELQDRDFEWFLNNYNDLYKKYGESFLAIKNNKVLGCYGSYQEAVFETEKTEELGSFIVQHCNGDESGYMNYISSMIFEEAVG